MQQEKITETKACRFCSVSFDITDKDLEFYEKISPVFSGAKYLIPSPTLCPDCRQQRRLSFRNERNLYKRKCDLTGKDIISIYSPDKPYKVYEQSEWWSDKWNAFDYGRDFNFSQSFFEQFEELMLVVPRIALNSGNYNENCDYNNFVSGSKDCYLNFGIEDSINCYYSGEISSCKDSIESYRSSNIENSGYIDWSSDIYASLFIENSSQIANSIFVKGSKNIQNGIFCVNVKNKKFVYKNEVISQEDFQKIYKDIQEKLQSPLGLSQLKKEFSEFIVKIPVINLDIYGSENCIGNLINNSKNCKYSFSIVNSENCKYIYDSFDSHECFDDNYIGNGVNNLYENINIFGSNNILFCESIFENSKDILYSSDCTNNSSNLFGCIGLRNAQYCILNKQYTKEEYENLVPKIIDHMKKTGEWGEFFPSSISPFGYNETVAVEYYPLMETSLQGETGLGRRFKWSTYQNPVPVVSKTIPASKLPDNIKDIPDDILNWAIVCEITNKPFRIIKQELEFYRKHSLPIPKRHPDQRHLDRMKLRNPRKLFDRKCDKCGIEIKTTYSPEREELIYCEDCYNKEVI